SALFINTMASRQAIRMQSDVGARAPGHCTSEGKALLAFRSPDIVERIVGSGLKAWTPRTIVKSHALGVELAAVRKRGFAMDDEEYEVGLRSVAAPIRDHRGNVVATISIAGPTQRVSRKVMQAYAGEVVAAAAAISQRLGYVPPRLDASR